MIANLKINWLFFSRQTRWISFYQQYTHVLMSISPWSWARQPTTIFCSNFNRLLWKQLQLVFNLRNDRNIFTDYRANAVFSDNFTCSFIVFIIIFHILSNLFQKPIIFRLYSQISYQDLAFFCTPDLIHSFLAGEIHLARRCRRLRFRIQTPFRGIDLIKLK